VTPEDKIEVLRRAIARLEERSTQTDLSEAQRFAVGKLINELLDVRLRILVKIGRPLTH
jgi:hypothetical protein